MSIYDYPRIRFNTALNRLEMNVGGEDWELVPVGNTAPAGSTTQVQFNNAGAFGASANFTWDNADGILFLGNGGSFPAISSLSATELDINIADADTTTIAVTPHVVNVTSDIGAALGLGSMTTTQRDALVAPVEGWVIYNITTHKLNVFTGTWEAVTSA